ncbi:hypothetical protein BLNAU_20022 [Blattamonas nauphoetae]|uniref:Uncharacterized protein n=1 Tax=Blattamonas nauphoetae TaxID=2049346 RepID=A0ABQ9WZX9_9EUKA|nr:hypothetical protein BLNAU_20022 [Blattamonas nauphoetae]
MPTTIPPMNLEALLMILINANRLSHFLYLPEMEEVVETVETWPADPTNAFEIAKGEFKCVSAPTIPLTQVEETRLKKEAKLTAAKKHRRNQH